MKKHILFFIESLSGGGAEKVLVTLLNHLDYSKYEITLITLVDTGVLREEIDKSRIYYSPVICEAKTKWQHLKNKIKYKLIYHYLPCRLVNRWIIPQKEFDIYIAFTEGFATKLLSYTSHKKIAWVHADLKTDPWTLKSFIFNDLQEEQKAYNQFDKVVCVSKSVEQVMRDYYGADTALTIYNPIDTDDIQQKANQPIGLNIPSSFNIVSVGRLVYQKGYDRLITVIKQLKDKGKDIQLYIIGEGSERKKLEDIIQDKGLQDVVHLMGFLKNPYALMKKMDLFVCSSIAEGYSLAIAEAMTLGLPILSTNCAGPNELLEYGKYGLLVENNEFCLYNGILHFIDDIELRENMKTKAIERSKIFGLDKSLFDLNNLLLSTNSDNITLISDNY